ncbi:MAG: hypothetical protein ABSA68_02620 [Xanthobacteraceae bacterium]|jgi:hypothetical protein
MLAITPFIELPSALAAEASTPAKIISFSELPVGWHYGEGSPPTRSTIDLAQDLYWLLLAVGYKQTDAFPGIHGEVMVTGYWGHQYIELIAEKDDSISVHFERNGKEIYSEGHHQFEEAAAALENFSIDDDAVGAKWITSGSYTVNTSTLTPTKTALRVWPLEIPMGQVFQSYNAPASMQSVVQYVNTPDIFTLNTSQAIHRFSGNLMKRFFQREAT